MRSVVIAGLGDSGVLTAIKLAKHADVVGISAKPGLVSGQELGWRLSRPQEWARHNWIPFDKFRGLDRVRTIHGDADRCRPGRAEGLPGRAPAASPPNRSPMTRWSSRRASPTGSGARPGLQSADEIVAGLRAAHDRLADAESVIVVGGGAAAVSSAAQRRQNVAGQAGRAVLPRRARAAASSRPGVGDASAGQLSDVGVELHAGHRAVIPDDFACNDITSAPVEFSTGQPPASADAVLWAIGRVRPNTDWLPAELLDEHGFVRVTPELRVPDHRGVFAIGDVAATDPLRTSARNRADGLLAKTSSPSSRTARCVLPPREAGDGVRSSGSSPTDSRSSRRTVSRSDSPPGRSNGC